MSADIALQRATVYLDEARDSSIDPRARFEALDAARIALLDARRARADPKTLLPIFNSILEIGSADRSHHVRLIVPQVVEELCSRDFRTFVPSATAHLFRCLQDDHVLVTKRAVRALTFLFRKLMGFIVSVGVGDNFPEARVSVWLQMQTKAVSLITSTDEGIRKAACKLAEAVVLAFSYGGAASAEHFTLDYVVKKAPKSTLLDKRKLEEEGVNCVKAVAQLVHDCLSGKVINTKPNGTSEEPSLAPATLMVAISVLGTIIRRRAKLHPLTVPPFLSVINAITGPPQEQSRAYNNLLESQRASIFAVLRITFNNVRAFSHTRAGQVGTDMTRGEASLVAYERELESRRRPPQPPVLSNQHQPRIPMMAPQRPPIPHPMTHRNPKLEPAPAIVQGMPPPPVVDLRQKNQLPMGPRDLPRDVKNVRPPLQGPPPPPHKRPRPPDQTFPWPRFAPQEAMAVTSELVRKLRPQEVVNFIMTRLLLNIPPAHTVPGALDPAAISNAPADPTAVEPMRKKPKASRFGTKNTEQAKQNAPAPKKVAVRKEAPPVVPVQLSITATEKLMTFCCRRILTRETQINASGAAPLRVQLLARILSTMAQRDSPAAREFCDEVCTYIVDSPKSSLPLALAWLHSLIVAEELAHLPDSPDIPADINVENLALPSRKKLEGTDKQSNLEASPVQVTVKEEPAEDCTETDKEDEKKERGEAKESAEESSEKLEDKQKIADPPSTVFEAVDDSMKDNESKETKTEPGLDTTLNLDQNDTKTSADQTGCTSNKVASTTDENMQTTVNTSADIEMKDMANSNGRAVQTRDIMDIELELEDPPKDEALVESEIYTRVLQKLITLFVSKPDALDLGLSQLLIDVPFLPQPILNLLGELCKDDPRNIKVGLQLLCDIIIERPGKDRDTCLDAILRLTSDEDELVRGPAIRTLTECVFEVASKELEEVIKNYGSRHLLGAVDAILADASANKVDALRRATLLPTALAGHRHMIVNVFKDAFVKSPPVGKQVIIDRAEDLVANLGVTSGPLLDLIRGKTKSQDGEESSHDVEAKGDEMLALALLRAVLKKSPKPGPSLVDASLIRYEACKDIEFVLAALPGLNKEQLIKYLQPIVEFVVKDTAKGTNKTISEGGNDMNKDTDDVAKGFRFKEVVVVTLRGKDPSITPAELLVELHKLKNNATVGLAIKACFELKALYKQEVVAQCLQQLLELSKVPDMLMRTVHLAKIFLPEMENYLTDTVMKRLIEKKVWTNKLLWEGFLLYCEKIREKASVRLLLSLPVAQLGDALNKKEALRNLFRELVANSKSARKIPQKHRRVITAALKKKAS